MSKKIGYARVANYKIGEFPTELDAQIESLTKAGCVQIYSDSGKDRPGFDRPNLHAALDALSPGDTFVVCRIDRLPRSITKTAAVLDKVESKGADFIALIEADGLNSKWRLN